MSHLCLGESSKLPQTCVHELYDLGRWNPVSTDMIYDYGFRQMAWINACELISDQRYSQNGGFAFLHKVALLPTTTITSQFSVTIPCSHLAVHTWAGRL